MSAIDQLLTYIRNLTPEQADKLVRHLPMLIESLEEMSSQKETRIFFIIKTLYQTNDVALLDLIDRLLRKSV